MATVTKPYTFTPGTTILASEVNATFDNLYNEFNGSIDAANLANNAVGQNQIADGAVVNAKISASAAIAFSKMVALTSNRVPVLNASGVIIASSVTDTELSYVSGVTSAIQTQIDGKEPSFSKNTAFNKNFGTAAGTVLEGSHYGTGGAVHADAVASGAAGFMTGADKAKLDAFSAASSYLRSDQSDSYTSGTLTFAASTTLDLSAASLILPVA